VVSFQGVVNPPGGPGEAASIELPSSVVSALGSRKRPPVKVTLNGYTYPTTIAVYGGKSYIGVRREIQQASGVLLGEPVDIVVEPDEATRTVELPQDLVRAFDAEPDLAAAFEQQSYTTRKEQVQGLLSAKRAETRDTRLKQVLEALRQVRH
jgi:Bacteriocin-protection, YdeI or OmpD-Associated/Domain of unknown function (DUF1905)